MTGMANSSWIVALGWSFTSPLIVTFILFPRKDYPLTKSRFSLSFYRVTNPCFCCCSGMTGKSAAFTACNNYGLSIIYIVFVALSFKKRNFSKLTFFSAKKRVSKKNYSIKATAGYAIVTLWPKKYLMKNWWISFQLEGLCIDLRNENLFWALNNVTTNHIATDTIICIFSRFLDESYCYT